MLFQKADIYQGNLILVNQDYPIRKEKSNHDLQVWDERYPNILLDCQANLEIHKLLQEIESKNDIVPVSGYRSLQEQEKIYQDAFRENGEKFTKQYVAYPNCSEHQTGLAIDLGLRKEKIDFIRPEFPYVGICQQFREKAAKYGWIQRYQEEKKEITKISCEEWHFRYVGYPHSEIIEKNNWCLEEYISYLKKFKFGKNAFIYQEYEISYLEMNEEMRQIPIEEKETIKISGNNVDGMVITKKRKFLRDCMEKSVAF